MTRVFTPTRRRLRGFTLIELLVAMALTLVAVIVVMQSLRWSADAQRRAISQDDAQVAGAIAMSFLQHDIRQAGAGIGDARLLGCELALPGGWNMAPLAPVAINPPGVPPGDPMTDTLLVAYGSDTGLPQGAPVAAQPAAQTYAMAGVAPVATGDWVIGWPPSAAAGACHAQLAAVTSTVVGRPTTVQTATGLGAAMTGGHLFMLGSRPRLRAYAVRGGRLTACDYLEHNCGDAALAADATAWVPVAAHVSALRAVYGRSHGGAPDAPVDTYSQTLPDSGCAWLRTPVVRLALLVRNAQPEKAAVAQPAPTWAGSDIAPLAPQAGGADWDHFHYSTFEVTVPLRNSVWRQRSSTC